MGVDDAVTVDVGADVLVGEDVNVRVFDEDAITEAVFVDA